jgi:hypothetical protein
LHKAIEAYLRAEAAWHVEYLKGINGLIDRLAEETDRDGAAAAVFFYENLVGSHETERRLQLADDTVTALDHMNGCYHAVDFERRLAAKNKAKETT